MKEVEEETGIEVEPVALLAVFDGMRLGFHSIPLYSLIFHCRMTGGQLKAHPLECLDVGFFARDDLPEPLAGGGLWVDMAFDAIEGRRPATFFDTPRNPTWRARPGEEH
jgi:8-oxo-dGTP pyrophosphatase MutT (NUDIX family)